MDILEDIKSYDTLILTESELRKGVLWHEYAVYYDDSFGSYAEAEKKFNNYRDKKSSSLGCNEYLYLRLFIVKEVTEDVSVCQTELPVTWRGFTIADETDNGKVFVDEDNRVRYTLNLTVHPVYDVW